MTRGVTETVGEVNSLEVLVEVVEGVIDVLVEVGA